MRVHEARPEVAHLAVDPPAAAQQAQAPSATSVHDHVGDQFVGDQSQHEARMIRQFPRGGVAGHLGSHVVEITTDERPWDQKLCHLRNGTPSRRVVCVGGYP